MSKNQTGVSALPSLCFAAALGVLCLPSIAAEPPDSRKSLQKRVEMLEKRLGEMQRALDESRALQAAQKPAPVAAAPAPPAADAAALTERLTELEQRVGIVESTAVLSEPKTTVKEITVYVDEDGNQFDVPTPGATPTITYQRERAYRRQVLSEEIEDALATEKQNSIALGVSNVTTVQAAAQTAGPKSTADRNVYGFSAVDVTFAASSAALNTSFYADLVGAGGSNVNEEIQTINLINGQLARISNNQLSVREAWVKTELFDKTLGLSVGRLDLTNYFDRNAVANDENERFINDALVNNPLLGLTTNGLGAVAVYDPKNGFNVKLGFQQSNEDATNLGDSIFVLGEVEYLARPFSLPEGHYRAWIRQDNSTGSWKYGYGLSLDQKVAPAVTLFGRYGDGFVSSIGEDMRYYSAGVGFQAPLTFNPADSWGIGYGNTKITSGPNQDREQVVEGYYNFRLTNNLSLSALLQYLTESSTGQKYLLPAVRLFVAFN